MGQLIAFLIRFRAFFVFLILEAICFWFIIGNNDYQRAAFINGASGFMGSVNATSKGIQDYFTLQRINQELATENAQLRELLQSDRAFLYDTLTIEQVKENDSIRFIFEPAEVIQNNFRNTNNFFMINKGRKDSIAEGMGVINSFGVVGKIRSVSEEFAQGISVLNTRNPISIKHAPSERSGTLVWEGRDPKYAEVLYITPDVDVQLGDTLCTSSYNAIFPKDIMVGTVSEISIDDNNTYLIIKARLSVDFAKLSYVYVIRNQKKAQMDSLNNNNPIESNE
jgi:rod shape-determining protein MreC